MRSGRSQKKSTTEPSPAIEDDPRERLRFLRARRVRAETKRLAEKWVDLDQLLDHELPKLSAYLTAIADRLDAEIEPGLGDNARDLAGRIIDQAELRFGRLRTKRKPKHDDHEGLD